MTFYRCVVPKKVFIGWARCKVKQYIPRPRRCFKCHSFNHGSKACKSDISFCIRCGEESHAQKCERPAKCKNIDDKHPASATDCFYYKLQQEALTIKTKEKRSYNEAKKLTTNKMIKPNLTYAAIVQSNNNEYSNRKPTSANLNVVTQRVNPPIQPQSFNIQAQLNNYKETPTTDITLATSSQPAISSSGATKNNKCSCSNKRPTNNKTPYPNWQHCCWE